MLTTSKKSSNVLDFNAFKAMRNSNNSINTNPAHIQGSLALTQQPEPTVAPATTKKEQTPSKPHIPVQAIKTYEQIEQAKQYFLTRPERYSGQNIRDWCMLIFGLYLGRRAGDLLSFKIEYVLDANGQIKDHFEFVEQKTQKTIRLAVHPEVRNALKIYIDTLEDVSFNAYLFPSRVKTYDEDGNLKPMTVKNLYKKMQQLKAELGIDEPFGTHSLRKTPGYHTLRENRNDPFIMAKMQKFYNHSSSKTTQAYVGLEQEDMEDMMLDFYSGIKGIMR